MTEVLLFLCVAFLFIYIIWWSTSPYLYLRPAQNDFVDSDDYCFIDIRDFVMSYHTPMNEAENIPLSYLQRAAKQKSFCKKPIVVIAEDHKSAKIAARILTKRQKKPIYYMTVS